MNNNLNLGTIYKSCGCVIDLNITNPNGLCCHDNILNKQAYDLLKIKPGIIIPSKPLCSDDKGNLTQINKENNNMEKIDVNELEKTRNRVKHEIIKNKVEIEKLELFLHDIDYLIQLSHDNNNVLKMLQLIQDYNFRGSIALYPKD